MYELYSTYINITHFVHKQVTPWGYSSEEITLFSSATAMDMELYEENGEWDVVEGDVLNHTR